MGTISVILTAPGWIGAYPSGVMSIARSYTEDSIPESKQERVEVRLVLSFFYEDKVRTYQPHDGALVITLRIEGYDVRRILVNQGSGAEIMYSNLNNGLNLKPEDLVSYDSPLVGFDGKIVILNGLIRFPVQAGLEVNEVNFIVVDVYSPYTAILARPWLHAMGAVSSTLHLKVKYHSKGQVGELIRSQIMARKCLVATIRQ